MQNYEKESDDADYNNYIICYLSIDVYMYVEKGVIYLEL